MTAAEQQTEQQAILPNVGVTFEELRERIASEYNLLARIVAEDVLEAQIALGKNDGKLLYEADLPDQKKVELAAIMGAGIMAQYLDGMQNPNGCPRDRATTWERVQRMVAKADERHSKRFGGQS